MTLRSLNWIEYQWKVAISPHWQMYVKLISPNNIFTQMAYSHSAMILTAYKMLCSNVAPHIQCHVAIDPGAKPYNYPPLCPCLPLHDAWGTTSAIWTSSAFTAFSVKCVAIHGVLAAALHMYSTLQSLLFSVGMLANRYCMSIHTWHNCTLSTEDLTHCLVHLKCIHNRTTIRSDTEITINDKCCCGFTETLQRNLRAASNTF